MHPRFGRRAAAFAPVAGDTARYDVLPVLAAALGDREHMVEGQFVGRKAVAAVLALVIVARVDVRARKRDIVEAPSDLDVAQQADDRRQFEADGNGCGRTMPLDAQAEVTAATTMAVRTLSFLHSCIVLPMLSAAVAITVSPAKR